MRKEEGERRTVEEAGGAAIEGGESRGRRKEREGE